MTKIYDIWRDRLSTGQLTKGQIRQFAAVASRDALMLPRQGNASALTTAEGRDLWQHIQKNPVLLTSEHTEQGLTWLMNHGRKQLGLDPELHTQLVDGFSHFTWDGSIELHNNGYTWSHAPVWTVHLRDGRQFRYWYAPGWREARGDAGQLWEVL